MSKQAALLAKHGNLGGLHLSDTSCTTTNNACLNSRLYNIYTINRTDSFNSI